MADVNKAINPPTEAAMAVTFLYLLQSWITLKEVDCSAAGVHVPASNNWLNTCLFNLEKFVRLTYNSISLKNMACSITI